MIDWILLGCIFVFIFGATFLLVRALTAEDPRIHQRLAESVDEAADRKDSLLLGEITEPLGTLTVPANEKRAALEQELREAGYYRSTAIIEYAALRALFIAFPLILGVLLAMIVERDVIPYVLGGAVLLALLGYSVPRVYISYQARQRASQIERGLPVAIDLLSLCLTGGQNLLIALARVSRDLETSFPVLAEELRIVNRHAEMVGLEMALQHFAARTNVQEVRNLSLILTHSERLGTDIGSALLEFSTSFRQTLRQRAEAYANRLSFFMLFPTIGCLLLPALVLFSAPVFYEFGRARKDLGENARKDLQVLKKAQTEIPH